MLIRSMKYRELFTFNYNNYTVEMEAEIYPNDNIDEAFELLKSKVREKLKAEADHYESLKEEINVLRSIKRHLEEQVRDVIDNVNYQNSISEIYGIPAPSFDIPF